MEHLWKGTDRRKQNNWTKTCTISTCL